MVLYSLILVSIGTGGIKSCIAAFGVDQLVKSDQKLSPKLVHVFFSTFYFSIHLGVFFGLLVSPIIAKIILYDGKNIDAYAIRFGLPVIMMSISIGKYNI